MYRVDTRDQKSIVRDVIDRHDNAPLDVEITFPDGRWVMQRKRRTADGGTVAVYSDITAIKKREAALAESEERHRRLLETLPDAVIIHSGGRVAYVNPAAELLYGAESHTQLVGRHSRDLVHPDYRALNEKRTKKVLAERCTLPPIEQVRVRLDGSEVAVETRTTFIVWNGKPALLGVMRDLTENKRAEAALRESERRLTAVTANIPGAVYQRVLHPDGRITFPYVSKGVLETHGMDAERAMADPERLLDVMHPGDREKYWAAIEESRDTLEPFDLELRNVLPGGDILWVLSHARPHRHDDGTVVWDGLFMNITDRKKAERRAAQVHSWLLHAIDSLPDGFVLWDREDRLMLWNDKYAKSVPRRDELLVAGSRFEDIIERAYDEMARRDGASVTGEWREQRLAWHRSATGSHELQMPSGRWVVVTERRTRDGFTVGIYTDISQHKLDAERIQESEERYRKLVEVSPDAIYVHRQGRIAFINSAGAELFGATSPEQLIGTKILDLVHPDYREMVSERQRQDVATAGLTRGNQLRLRLDGSEFMAAVSANPVTWEGERGGLVVIRDITEENRAQEALRESEQTARALIDAATDYALLLDRDLKILAINNTLAGAWDVTPADAVGRSVAEVSPPAARDRRQWLSEKVLRSGRPEHIETRMGEQWISSSYHPVLDASNRVSRLAIFSRDITEQKEAQAKLRDANETAEFASRSKSEFLANMSHELRTPLNAVIGFSEIMKEEIFGPLGSDNYRTYSRDIHESGKHLLRVINDILDLSKIEAGKLTPNFERIDLRDAVDSSVRIVKGRAEERAIRIVTRIAQDQPRIEADERMLKQILMNLLSNAVKFTSSGGKIRVSVRPGKNGRVDITVADNGIGIESHELPKVMAPFGQAESSLSRKFEGTGLGLPLTRSLVELHHGEFKLLSKPGRGTKVVVSLPMRQNGAATES